MSAQLSCALGSLADKTEWCEGGKSVGISRVNPIRLEPWHIETRTMYVVVHQGFSLGPFIMSWVVERANLGFVQCAAISLDDCSSLVILVNDSSEASSNVNTSTINLRIRD